MLKSKRRENGYSLQGGREGGKEKGRGVCGHGATIDDDKGVGRKTENTVN